MSRRTDHSLAGLFAGLAFLLSSCSKQAPTSPTIAATPAGPQRAVGDVDPRTKEDAAAGRPVITLVPKAIAAIRRFPELGLTDGGGTHGDMVSDYFRTTQTNREFRGGSAEFAPPRSPGRLLNAMLILREPRAGIADPRPPDRHELSSYDDADLDVTLADFDRPTVPLVAFETD